MQDVDAAGIVFFPRLLEYCHDAYFEMLTDGGLNLPEAIADGPVLLPLVHCEADFKRPLHFGDTITVSITATAIRNTSFEVSYEITGATSPDTLLCSAKTVHAVVDRVSFRPARIVPEPILKALRL